MHHSHAALTVTSLPSASYLTWGSVLRNFETPPLRPNGGPPRRHLWYPREARGKPVGARVVGRHLYDMTNAGAVRHPMDVTTVVSPNGAERPHDHENFVFVTDGIEAAVAKAKDLAGARTSLSMAGGWPGSLEAGLLDAVGVELVPVVLGGGRRCSPSSAPRRCSSRDPSRWSRAPASRTCATGYRDRPRPKGSCGGHPWP